MKGTDRKRVHSEIRDEFKESLNSDEAFRDEAPGEPRWDYVLGHGPTGSIVGFEVHPATPGEVANVVRKKAATANRLRAHLRVGREVAAWYWVASGKVGLAPLSKFRRQLLEKGIQFVGRALEKANLTEDLESS